MKKWTGKFEGFIIVTLFFLWIIGIVKKICLGLIIVSSIYAIASSHRPVKLMKELSHEYFDNISIVLYLPKFIGYGDMKYTSIVFF